MHCLPCTLKQKERAMFRILVWRHGQKLPTEAVFGNAQPILASLLNTLQEMQNNYNTHDPSPLAMLLELMGVIISVNIWKDTHSLLRSSPQEPFLANGLPLSFHPTTCPVTTVTCLSRKFDLTVKFLSLPCLPKSSLFI